jgi:hypothetical protein
MHNSTTLSQPWVSDNPEFEAWWSDDKRSGSTFGYQDTKEGVWIAFKMQAFNGWLLKTLKIKIFKQQLTY